MPKDLDRKNRGNRFSTKVNYVPLGIGRYQSMADKPVFIVTIDGTFYQLDNVCYPQLKRLDCKV